MLAPKININGTSAESLRTEYMAAFDAVNNAVQAVADITVHGRDYDQVQAGSLSIAQRDRQDMTKRLFAISEELFNVVIDINKQKEG